MIAIDTVQLRDALRFGGDFTIINVDPAWRFQARHIPGAVNVPIEDPNFSRRVTMLIDEREHPIVVYSARHDDDASHHAARRLDAAGFAHVYLYNGGLEAWQAADQPVESESG